MDRVGNRSSKDTGGVNRVCNSMNNRSSMMNNGGSMVNNWSSMVNNWSSMDNRSMMNNWCSMDNRCMVNNWCSVDSGCSSIASYSLIGHVNYITRVTVSSIADHLGSAVRESHPIVTRSRVAIP